jgi:hypothetical protein
VTCLLPSRYFGHGRGIPYASSWDGPAQWRKTQRGARSLPHRVVSDSDLAWNFEVETGHFQLPAWRTR